MGTTGAEEVPFSPVFIPCYVSIHKSRLGEGSLTFHHFCHHVVFRAVSADCQLFSQPLKGTETVYRCLSSRSSIPDDLLLFTC